MNPQMEMIQPAADLLARIMFMGIGAFTLAVLVPMIVTLVRLLTRP